MMKYININIILHIHMYAYLGPEVRAPEVPRRREVGGGQQGDRYHLQGTGHI